MTTTAATSRAIDTCVLFAARAWRKARVHGAPAVDIPQRATWCTVVVGLSSLAAGRACRTSSLYFHRSQHFAEQFLRRHIFAQSLFFTVRYPKAPLTHRLWRAIARCLVARSTQTTI